MDRRQEDEVLEEGQLCYLDVCATWSYAECIYQLYRRAKGFKTRGAKPLIPHSIVANVSASTV